MFFILSKPTNLLDHYLTYIATEFPPPPDIYTYFSHFTLGKWGPGPGAIVPSDTMYIYNIICFLYPRVYI